jgi:chemotaxis protein MotB
VSAAPLPQPDPTADGNGLRAPASPPVPPEEPPPEDEGLPPWVMTFGDMMSLLLTFFILLFSMSELEVEKFKLAAESIRGGFGSVESDFQPNDSMPGSTPADTTVIVPLPDATDRELDRIAEVLQQFVEENNLEQNVVVERENHGVFLRIQDVALFPPGAASIEISSQWIVEQLGTVTRMIEAPVIVSGHTDSIPIGGGLFRSNWELSAARASGVARALVTMGQDPYRVRVEAFGEYQPVASNDTEEGRAQNRRVELFYSRQNVEETLQERLGTEVDSVSAVPPG